MRKAVVFLLLITMLFSLTSCKKESTVERDNKLHDMAWTDILAEAKGKTVNFYMWGGDANVNGLVENEMQTAANEFGITINRVGVTNLSEAINKVVGEKQANKNEGGSVDLIWINGENFMTMKQGELLFGGWAEKLPNAELVNWADPSIKSDMGYPVEGYESPWGTAQFQMIYDSAKINESDLPKNFDELMTFAKNNEGRFTYCAPPEFYGTRFIKQAIYEMTGGFEQYNKESITKEQFVEMSKPAWDYLSQIEPYLWRKGETYPKSIGELNKLFNDGEIDFSVTLAGGGIHSAIVSGQLPETARVYCMDTAIADTNYVAIPYNSSAKAAAMVLANVILSPEMQAKNLELTGNAPAITYQDQAVITNIFNAMPEGTYIPAIELERTRNPEVSGYLNNFINEIWQEKINS